MIITTEKPSSNKWPLWILAANAFAVLVALLIWPSAEPPAKKSSPERLTQAEKVIEQQFNARAIIEDYHRMIAEICDREDIFESEITYQRIFQELRVWQSEFWTYYEQRKGEPGRRDRAAIQQSMKDAILDDCIACGVLPTAMPKERINAAVFKYLDKIAPPEDGSNTYKHIAEHYAKQERQRLQAEATQAERAQASEITFKASQPLREDLIRLRSELLALKNLPPMPPAPNDTTESLFAKEAARANRILKLENQIRELEAKIEEIENAPDRTRK